MDAELFKIALAAGRDTSTNAPAPAVPARQNTTAPPPSSDPFADLFTKQPPSTTLPSRQDTNSHSSQAREYGQGSSFADTLRQATLRCQQDGMSLMPGLNRPGSLGNSAMPSSNSAGMGGGGHDNIAELMEHFGGLMVQAGAQIGEPPAMSMARAQRVVQRWSWNAPPMGRVKLVQGIARLERQLGSGGSGIGGGYPPICGPGNGFDDDDGW